MREFYVEESLTETSGLLEGLLERKGFLLVFLLFVRALLVCKLFLLQGERIIVEGVLIVVS